MNKVVKHIKVLSLFLLLLLTSCADKTAEVKTRAMYYWNTTFRIDAQKERFLAEHKVERLYVRYFDVVENESGEPMPNATIDLPHAPLRLPHEGEGSARKGKDFKLEIIPTVYVHNDCMRKRHDGLAEKILKRLLQMSETHHMGKVNEIQMDCDWTQSTRQNFFAFLEELHAMTQQKGITLSATIRLHQLSQPVPPVDCGVLMVYNTGDLRKMEVEKPILDLNDVKPYLGQLKKYDLRMAAAFPIYKWDLVFRNGKFVDIQHEEGEIPMLETDTIVTREPTLQDILECKEAVAKACPDCMSEIILFDLNNYNINRYKQADYEKIFN